MRADKTVYYPTFASHVLYGHAEAKPAATVLDCAEPAALKQPFVPLLPAAAAVLLAPPTKGRLRLACKPAPDDEAQRG